MCVCASCAVQGPERGEEGVPEGLLHGDASGDVVLQHAAHQLKQLLVL